MLSRRFGTLDRYGLISRSGSKIRLNDSYAQAVVQSKDKETMQLWKGRLTEARELLHSIEQREKTLLKVARAILAHQEAFFDKGPSALRPLVLRQIADETELHESTVSVRAAASTLSVRSGCLN